MTRLPCAAMHFPPGDWLAFLGVVAALLALDLGVVRRGSRGEGLKAGVIGVLAWAAVAAAFGLWVAYHEGGEPAQQFAAGYLMELSLSVDNLFVFVLVFNRFRIPDKRQHRVLFWGILGAAVMRILFILGGLKAISHAHWLVPVGGGLILITGLKLGFSSSGDSESLGGAGGAVAGWLTRRLPMNASSTSDRFFVVEHGRRLATPLFAALLVLETADLIFALDSLPAVIAITRSAFIATTSNIFAILGLRSLYLVVHGSFRMFRFLNIGLAVLLVFVGLKMLAEHWVQVSTPVSLAVIGGVLAVSIGASLMFKEKPGRPAPKGPQARP